MGDRALTLQGRSRQMGREGVVSSRELKPLILSRFSGTVRWRLSERCSSLCLIPPWPHTTRDSSNRAALRPRGPRAPACP